MAQIWGRIDYPKREEEAGTVTATGVAMAEREIPAGSRSADDGESWADATLEPSLNPPFTWVRGLHLRRPARRIQDEDARHRRHRRGYDRRRAVPLPDGATGWPDREFDLEGRRIIHLVPGSPG